MQAGSAGPVDVNRTCKNGKTHNTVTIQITAWCKNNDYRKTSNIRRTLVGNKIVDHSDVVGASALGAAPPTPSFSTWHLASRDSAKKATRHHETLLSVGIWCVLYERLDGMFFQIHLNAVPIKSGHSISLTIIYCSSRHRSCQHRLSEWHTTLLRAHVLYELLHPLYRDLEMDFYIS